MQDRGAKTTSERRGFLKALGLGAGVAVASVAATPEAEAQGARPAKENEQQRGAARYRESDHVKAFYRTNRYEH